jgi:outer membrane protein assembly factor BamB
VNNSSSRRWFPTASQLLMLAVAGAVFLSLPASRAQEAPAAAAPADEAKAPGNMMDKAVETGGTLYVSDSFAAAEKLRTAQRFEAQNQTQLALQKYQEVLDEYSTKVFFVGDDYYQSMGEYVRQRLLEMPAVQRGDYDQLFGPMAERNIKPAIAAMDVVTIIRECDRYFPAQVAGEGMEYAAQLFFERGDFSAAAKVWRNLLAHPRMAARKAELLFRCGLAEALAGNSSKAEKYRAQLAADFAQTDAVINGRSVRLLDELEQLLKVAAPVIVRNDTISPGEWPGFLGGAGRNDVPKANVELGARLWNYNYDGQNGPLNPEQIRARRDKENLRKQMLRNQGVDLTGAEQPANFPALGAGRIYVNSGEVIQCLNSTNGELVWQYPKGGKSAIPKQNPNEDYNPYGMVGSEHNTICVAGKFVITAAPNPKGSNVQPVAKLLCLDRDTGKEVWSADAGTVIKGNQELKDKDPNEINRGRIQYSSGMDGNAVFAGAPLISDQSVIMPVRVQTPDGMTEVHLTRLNLQTGAKEWSTYLCSRSSNGYYGGPRDSYTPMTAMADDTIYLSTGVGADLAVDASTGRTLWLQTTEKAKLKPTAMEYGGSSRPIWQTNAPVIYQDKVITFEGDSNLRVYERTSGKLAGRIVPKSQDNAGILAGIVNDKMYLIGTRIRIIDAQTLKLAAEPVELPAAGKLAGRPFISDQILVLPMEKGLFTYDLATDKARGLVAWPKGDNQQPGQPGNVIMTNDQLLVAGTNGITSYSTWELAVASRQREINERPQDPIPSLMYAEMAFRTGRFEIATQQMRAAVTKTLASQDEAAVQRIFESNLYMAEQLMTLPERKPDQTTMADGFFRNAEKIARNPVQQAQWRISEASLLLKNDQNTVAVQRLHELLAQSEWRKATVTAGDSTTRASAQAEVWLRGLSSKADFAALYDPYHQKAQAALNAAQGNRTALGEVMESYPISPAGFDAGVKLLALTRAQNDYPEALRVARWLNSHAADDKRAQGATDLALAYAQSGRPAAVLAWAERLGRQYSTLDVAISGQTCKGSEARSAILKLLPPEVATVEPKLDLTGIKDADNPLTLHSYRIGTGYLLAPLDTPRYRNAETAVLHRNERGTNALFLWDAKSMKHKAEIALTARTGIALQGWVGEKAIVVASNRLLALNGKEGTLAWEASFPVKPDQLQLEMQMRNMQQNALSQNAHFQLANNENYGISNNIQVGSPLTTSSFMGDVDPLRTGSSYLINNYGGGMERIGAVRLAGQRVIVAQHDRLEAIDVQSGKRVWANSVTLPSPVIRSLQVNESVATIMVDMPEDNTSKILVVDIATGNLLNTITNPDSGWITWQQLSDDDMLVTMSTSGVSAYDLSSDVRTPRWTNKNFNQNAIFTVVLTPYGLVTMEKDLRSAACYSLDDGKTKVWTTTDPLRLQDGLLALRDQRARLRSFLVGDTLYMQSATNIAALNPTSGQMLWQTATVQAPPRVATIVADKTVVTLATGINNRNGNRSTALLAINRKGGSLMVQSPLTQSGGPADLRGWQVLDNRILLNIGNEITALIPERTTPAK